MRASVRLQRIFGCAKKTLTDLMTFVDIFLYISYSLSGCGLSTIY